MKKIIIMSVVLCLAIFIQIKGGWNRSKKIIAMDLAEIFPREIPGWTVEEKPIADSQEMQKAVESILNYDSAIFRVYRSRGEEISIYAAYWTPGKIYPQAVDAHTPDVCWTANGWKMEKLPALGPRTVGTVQIDVPNNRLFNANGQTLSVIYWHINGHSIRKSYSITEEKLSIGQRFGKMWMLLTQPAQQQLFVRISSNRNIEVQLDEAPVQAALSVISRALRQEVFFSAQE